MSDRVFISYARADQKFVLRLASELRTRGLSIWLDQWDISPGADWDQSIDRALRESKRLIVILSPAAVTSRQVRAEIQAALDTAKAVFPVLYKDCEVPRVIRLYEFLDFRDDHEYSQKLERLAEALRGEKGPLPPPYPPSTASKIWRTRRLMAAAAVVALVGGGLLLFIFSPFSGPIPNEDFILREPPRLEPPPQPVPLPSRQYTAPATPSFDCAKARLVVETLICNDVELAALDRMMAETYRAVRGTMSPDRREHLRREQSDWLAQRNSCQSGADPRRCVKDLYVSRTAELRGL